MSAPASPTRSSTSFRRCWAPRAQDFPVRPGHPAGRQQGRPLGHAVGRRRGALRRVDPRRPAATSVVPWAAPGQDRPRRYDVSPESTKVAGRGRRSRADAVQPGQGALPRGRLHQGRGHRLLHPHRAGAAAAPGQPGADPEALPRRRRGQVLLREELALAPAGLGARRRAAVAGLDQEPRDHPLHRHRRTAVPCVGGQPGHSRAAHADVDGRPAWRQSTTPTCWCSTSTQALRPPSSSAARSPCWYGTGWPPTGSSATRKPVAARVCSSCRPGRQAPLGGRARLLPYGGRRPRGAPADWSSAT